MIDHRVSNYLLFLCIVFYSLVFSSFAIDEQEMPAIPKDGLVLNKDTVSTYSPYLPQILKEVIESEVLTSQLLSTQISIKSNSAAVNQQSSNRQAVSRQEGVRHGGLLTKYPPSKSLYPFSISSDEQATHTNDLGYQLLWNTESIYWSNSIISTQFISTHFNESSSFKFGGTFTRAYPFTFEKGLSEHLLREKMIITKPESVSGFGWVTYRLFNNIEDFLWVISPTSKDPRQITGSNRNDSLVNSSFALDDLFSWSGRVENIDVTLAAKETVGAPLIKSAPPMQVKSVCTEVENDFYNTQDEKFPINLRTPLILRPVFRIELQSKDPYSLYGKQFILIDRELFVPYYKIVFDRNGSLWKLVITSFNIINDTNTIIPVETVIYDSQNRSSSIFGFHNWRFCKNFSDTITARDFDPFKLNRFNDKADSPTLEGTPLIKSN